MKIFLIFQQLHSTLSRGRSITYSINSLHLPCFQPSVISNRIAVNSHVHKWVLFASCFFFFYCWYIFRIGSWERESTSKCALHREILHRVLFSYQQCINVLLSPQLHQQIVCRSNRWMTVTSLMQDVRADLGKVIDLT